MLPDEQLSSELVYGEFKIPLIPSDLNYTVDYSFGGDSIEGSTQSLDYQVWSCYLNENNYIIIKDSFLNEHVMFQAAVPVKRLTFSFDQIMKPTIAYSSDDGVYLYWYDTTLSAYTTTFFPDYVDPYLTLDETRSQYIYNSDIIFFYVYQNNLCYRQQRDRFRIEKVLKYNFNSKLIAAGKNVQERLQLIIRSNSYNY